MISNEKVLGQTTTFTDADISFNDISINQLSYGQTGAIIQSNTISANLNAANDITSSKSTPPFLTVTITSANSTSTNGITAGSLVDGQTGIVLFGFNVAASGTTTINEFDLTGSQGGLFVNGKLYRTAAGGTNYSGATLVAGATVTFSGNNPVITGLSETITNTNYTYFLVADLAKSYGTIPGNFQVGFSQAIQPSPYTTYTASISGINFSLVKPTLTLTDANTSSNGITQGTIITNQTSIVLFGFGVSSNANSTVSTFNINASSSTANYLGNYLGNGKLYRSASSTFSLGTATQVTGATVTFYTYQNTPGVNITGLSESIGSSIVYYFIIGDFNQTSGAMPANLSIKFSTTQTNAFVLSNSATIAASSNITGKTFAFSNPTITLTDANTVANGITQGTIISGQTGIVLFGFGLSSNGSSTIGTFNINASSSTANYLGNYLGNGKLYRSASSTFSLGTATQITGATVAFYTYQNTPGITISGLTESIGASTTYYFVVADFNQTSGALPANLGIKFSTTQTNAFILSNSSTVAAPANITGKTFSFSNPVVTLTGANASGNGITQGALYPGETGIVLFGFGVQVAGASTISGFDLYNNYNAGVASAYLNNGKIYRSTSSTFSLSTATLISGATVTFGYDAPSGIAITGLSESFNNNASPVYYFIVGDFYSAYYGALPATSQFSFLTTQAVSIVQSSPSASNIVAGSNIAGTNFTLNIPTTIVTGANNPATNGITSGALSYGQTNIVLFGFGVQPSGGPQTFTKFNIKTSGSENSYFSNGRLYRSTTPVFPGGTPVYTSGSISIAGGGYINCTVNETIPAGTTYYYWFVADYNTVTFGAANPSYTFSFVSGQSTAALVAGSNSYNTYNITGNAFNIVTSYNWIGNTNDITLNTNYGLLGGGNPASSPAFTGSTVNLIIGGAQTYTVAPAITANTELGGITFASTTPNSILTIAAGKTLKLNSNGLTTVSGSNPTITGGTLTLASNSTSSVAASSTLNLSGVTVNNAGVFSSGASSTINLTGSASLANTGTFTLGSTSVLNLNNSSLSNTGTGVFTFTSDATGSAALGPLVGSSTVTGNYAVQRFLTGGSSFVNARYVYRNYRLMSSPVSNGTDSHSNLIYSLTYIGASAIVTDAVGGYNQSGNPTLYLFRENTVPNNSSFTSGNYRGVNNISTTNIGVIGDSQSTYNLPVGNGFLFYFRGNASNPTIKTNAPYTAPENTTFSNTGTLNTGNITVKDWFNPTSSNLSFTTNIANTGIRGYNLVGNPYPSSISWTSVYNANSAGGHLNATIYEFNPMTNQYGAYIAGGAGTGGFGDVIGSGEGFFAIANDASAQVNFSESNKVATSQPSTLLLGLPVGGNVAKQYVHIKMIKDTFNYDDVIIGFKPNADEKYVVNEDALHLTGNAPPETFTTLSSDSVNLSINYMSLPAKTQQVIRLNANATTSGLYQFSRTELVGIPELYEIWLKDNLQKDSLDFRANTTYTFRIDNTNPATYGSKRFQIVVRQNPGLGLHLLAFDAAKISNVIQVKVNWTVENEANYTTFFVQRSVDNGKTFQSIGSLQSDGSGSYSYIDKYPSIGQNQYRLQLSDVNTTITYSGIISIQYSDLSNKNIAAESISLYPNPAHDLINLSVTNPTTTASSYSISITNTSGNIIKTTASTEPTWQNNVSDLLPGVYFVQVVDNSSKKVVGKTKFIKL